MLVVRITGNMAQVLDSLRALILLHSTRTLGCLLRQHEAHKNQPDREEAA